MSSFSLAVYKFVGHSGYFYASKIPTLMIKTIFTPNKGYHIADLQKEAPEEAIELNYPLITNGFDQLSWQSEENQETSETTDKVYSDDEHSSDKLREASFNNEYEISDTLLTTHKSLFGDDLSDHENDTSLSKSHKGHKKMTNKERKKLKRLKKSQRKDRKQIISNDSASSVDRAVILKELYQTAVGSADSNALIRIRDVTIFSEDLETLLDDNWLDDSIISFAYEYIYTSQIIPTLTERVKYGRKDQVKEALILLLPTFSFLLANSPNPLELKDVLPNLEHSSFIFMPVNDNIDFGEPEGGSHWSLVLFCVDDRKAIIYDSLYRANEEESMRLIKNTEAILRKKFEIITEKHTPQQINSSDCGIIVIAITALLTARVLNVEDNRFLNLKLDNVELSAIDARIFLLGTIANLVKLKSKK